MSSSGQNVEDTPVWVDEKFVAEALSEGEEDTQVEAVTSLRVEPAVKKGANFMSSLLRLSCGVRPAGGGAEEDRSLILKVGLSSGPMAELAEAAHVFDREVRVYRELLPRAEEALRAAEGGGAGWRPLAPRALAAGPGGGGRPPWLLMDDLIAAGFRSAPAGEGLDRAHCSLALRALARLHAASALLLEQTPSLRADPLFSPSPLTSRGACDELDKIVPRHARALSAALAASGRLALAGKYEAAAERIVGRLRELEGGDPPALPVVLHGDVWKNNFLFRYSEQQPTDVRVLDYQMVNIGAPATDVVHFLYANASEECHRQHFEQLVGEYHETLQATLRALGLERQADAYPLLQLQADMDRCTPIALHCAILMGVVIGATDHGAAVADSFYSEDERVDELSKVFSNPKYLSCIEYLSPRFENLGVL